MANVGRFKSDFIDVLQGRRASGCALAVALYLAAPLRAQSAASLMNALGWNSSGGSWLATLEAVKAR